MNALREKLKKEKVIIGMVHLLPLPGSPAYQGDLEKVYEAGLKDLRALEKGGAGALIIENFGDVLQICGGAILAAVCLTVLRGLDKSGISSAVSVCIGTVFAMTALYAAKPILQTVRSYGNLYFDNPHMELLLRAMAIGILVQLTADTVRDAGEGLLADRVETVGRVVLLCVGMPLYQEMLSLAGTLLGM